MIRTTSSRFSFPFVNTLLGVTNIDKRFQGNTATKGDVESNKNLHYSPETGHWCTSLYEPVQVPNLPLDKYVWMNVNKWEKKTAAVCVESGREYTYAKLRDHSSAFAIRLQSLIKLKFRDMVAICLPNLPEYPIVALGSIEAGMQITTVNPIYTAEEIARHLILSEAKVLVGTVNGYSTLKQACSLAKLEIPIIVIPTANEIIPDGAANFFDLYSTFNVDHSALKQPQVNPDDILHIPFSSGTTGLPKGVQLSHNNICVNCEQIQVKTPHRTIIRETTETEQEVIPCVLPFFHIYGFSVIMMSKLFLGTKLVTLPRYTPDDLLRSLRDYGASSYYLVPPIILFMASSDKIKAKDAPNLRMIVSGAAPIGQADVNRLLDKFPNIEFSQGFGMTESSPVTFFTPNDCKKYHTVGYPISSTEAKVIPVDSNDTRGLASNKTGEICVRGPQVMAGYYKNEEANAAVFLECPRGKWLRTGDIGHYDEDGSFIITDRLKELIKTKGFQVPPAELEECLRTHPKILDAAVIGIPHEKYGEVPKGFVVLKDNTLATEKEIQEFVKEKVAPYKQLIGGVEFLKEIPKTNTGKIQRKELKKKYC